MVKGQTKEILIILSAVLLLGFVVTGFIFADQLIRVQPKKDAENELGMGENNNPGQQAPGTGNPIEEPNNGSADTQDKEKPTKPHDKNKPGNNDIPTGKGTIMVGNPDDIDVLVNKTRELSPDYEPADLVLPNVLYSPGAPNRYLREEAAQALEELFKGAQDAGYKLYAYSGYRSYKTQDEIFKRNVKRYGSVEKANRTSAKPGQSEHQTGLAMDITSDSVDRQITTAFAESAEGRWVTKNAHKYGFVIRFLKEKEAITGYSYEPWHLRYLGVELATELYNSGLAYEEYLGVADKK